MYLYRVRGRETCTKGFINTPYNMTSQSHIQFVDIQYIFTFVYLYNSVYVQDMEILGHVR